MECADRAAWRGVWLETKISDFAFFVFEGAPQHSRM